MGGLVLVLGGAEAVVVGVDGVVEDGMVGDVVDSNVDVMVVVWGVAIVGFEAVARESS